MLFCCCYWVVVVVFGEVVFYFIIFFFLKSFTLLLIMVPSILNVCEVSVTSASVEDLRHAGIRRRRGRVSPAPRAHRGNTRLYVSRGGGGGAAYGLSV